MEGEDGIEPFGVEIDHLMLVAGVAQPALDLFEDGVGERLRVGVGVDDEHSHRHLLVRASIMAAARAAVRSAIRAQSVVPSRPM